MATIKDLKRMCDTYENCIECPMGDTCCGDSPVAGINVNNNQYNERELCESQVTEAWNKRVSELEHRPMVHAYWVWSKSGMFQCSNCKKVGHLVSDRFCPNCGANMDMKVGYKQ